MPILKHNWYTWHNRHSFRMKNTIRFLVVGGGALSINFQQLCPLQKNPPLLGLTTPLQVAAICAVGLDCRSQSQTIHLQITCINACQHFIHWWIDITPSWIIVRDRNEMASNLAVAVLSHILLLVSGGKSLLSNIFYQLKKTQKILNTNSSFLKFI